MSEKVIETRTCRQCSISFPITDADMEFYVKVSPTFNGKKELIPPPTLCPECRQRRRLVWRNERKLYKRKCNLTGRDILAAHDPTRTHPVYEFHAWWWDGWDPLQWGREFDFSRPFFEQFRELIDQVPAPSRSVANSENCNFTNNIGLCHNCYLLFNSNASEDCYYSTMIDDSKSVVDCLYVKKSENMYECVECIRCYGCRYCTFSRECSESYFLYDCIQCRNCFGCCGLRNREYCWYGEQLTKEEYQRRTFQLSRQNILEHARRFAAYVAHAPHRHLWIEESEQVSSSNNIVQSKNIVGSYDVVDGENLRYCGEIAGNAKNCMDMYTWGENADLIYETIICGRNVSQVLFSADCWNDSDHILYSLNCVAGNHHLFGCASLRWKSYCILNKQYTKEEYEALVPQIIAHMRETSEWGEFFSPSISPFGYNETIAQDHFPITREEALKQGFGWSDYEPPAPQVSKTLPAHLLPDDITQIPDDILNWAIVCEVTGKPFRIIKQELDFYRKHHLPIPRRHPDQRHLDRMALRNPRKLHERKCDQCGTDMQTTYAPDRPEIVYCEQCYQKHIYG